MRKLVLSLALLPCFLAAIQPALLAQQPPGPPRAGGTNDPIERIKDEGFNRSQVMPTLSYLTDVIGPRLTASPNLKRANEWTRGRLESWGLTNAHLEAWGPFGRGWSLKRFSAQVIEPQGIPLIAQPKAWTPGVSGGAVTAEVIYLDAKTDKDLDQYKGKLKGAIVLSAPPLEVRARFAAPATRLSESNLLVMANAPEPRPGQQPGIPFTSSLTSTQRATLLAAQAQMVRRYPFIAKEEPALIIEPSFSGDGGTFFIASATVPAPFVAGANTPPGLPSRSAPWSTNAPKIPPQAVVAVEDYNRMIRMIQAGEKLKMAVELDVQFHDKDLMAYNTIAEIPGTDLKDEIVMLGAHMDSWHSGTGATDNGAGCAVAMEAVRIIKATGLQPRRTIRIGLWSGEEQGLLGSRAYVSEHFGRTVAVTNTPPAGDTAKADKEKSDDKAEPKTGQPKRSPFPFQRTPTRVERKPDYEKFSAYFNLDNGTGKIRGVYLQGNEAVRPIFRQWLAPFREHGAETLTPNLTGGTDHLSFDSIGLPGFQFIQDDIEYWSRTHHSNQDVFDRAQADDLKQASVIMAAFVYNTAMANEKLPRKPASGR